MNSPLFEFQSLRGTEITPFIDELGALRIAVFREFPYLYEGTMEYERPYLARYAASERSLIVLVKHDEKLVGATSCLPLEEEMGEFRHPFEESGLTLSAYFYFGESIILPPYRGQGVGGEFFRFREAHAASFGTFRFTTFCAVKRPHDHPDKPPGYRTLNKFWERQGYRRHPERQCQLAWQEPGTEGDVRHTLTFWTKEINASETAAEP